MISIKHTMERATAFTELTDETNNNTHKQLQAVTKCCEDVQTPGPAEKSLRWCSLRKPSLLCNPCGEWQKNGQRGLEGGREGWFKWRPWQCPEGLGGHGVKFWEQGGDEPVKRLEAQASHKHYVLSISHVLTPVILIALYTVSHNMGNKSERYLIYRYIIPYFPTRPSYAKKYLKKKCFFTIFHEYNIPLSRMQTPW